VRLSDLLGQDAARTALARAVAGGHVAHAYLFEGPAGVGKRGAAYGLAMALSCREAPGEGCGACDTCRRIEAGNHPDVLTFGPTGPGGQIVAEDAKTIVALARTRPHEAAARVIVVDEAHALNPTAANGLLKTLEEPLARNHIVLCTSAPDRLLPTIRSRAQRIRFRPLSAATLGALADRRALPAARREIAIATADGSAARMFETAEAEEAGGPVEALAALRALVARVYRDALAAAAGAPELGVLTGAGTPAGGPEALVPLGVDRIGRGLAAIVEAQLALPSNVNPVLAVERLLFALRRQERPAA